MSAYHLGHRKGGIESNGKERIKTETRIKQGTWKKWEEGGWGYLNEKQWNRRCWKNRASALMNPLFHSFLKFFYFFQSWTLPWFQKCLENPCWWWLLFSHWRRPNLQLPREDISLYPERTVSCKTLEDMAPLTGLQSALLGKTWWIGKHPK